MEMMSSSFDDRSDEIALFEERESSQGIVKTTQIQMESSIAGDHGEQMLRDSWAGGRIVEHRVAVDRAHITGG
jgi:hypothetical protein